MITEKQKAARIKWGGQSVKLRRLAYIKRRYAAPPRCRDCASLAHWTWGPLGKKRDFYCPTHLPEQARTILGNFHQTIFTVAPFFDEPEQEDTPYL